jgi:hypothetical protein
MGNVKVSDFHKEGLTQATSRALFRWEDNAYAHTGREVVF